MKPILKSKGWRRVWMPYLWWLLLVLVLWGLRTHERKSANTKIFFVLEMSGQRVEEGTVTVDEREVTNGERIPIGWHTIRARHPLADPFVTNVFVWYGDFNLNFIKLNRSQGELQVTVSPPAERLFVYGREWSVEYTNSSGLTSSVPTDEYTISARYPFSQTRETAVVTANVPTARTLVTRFGSLEVTCNQPDARFQLSLTDGQTLLRGDVPVLLTNLPAKAYEVTVRHHGYERRKELMIAAAETNASLFEFHYGAVSVTTEPVGVRVSAGERELGQTPLLLPELPVGNYALTLEMSGYEPVTAAVSITAGRTNEIRTNLVSRSYLSAMAKARNEMRAMNYMQAINTLAEVLQMKANDPEALSLRDECRMAVALQRAEVEASRSNFSGAIKELRAALAAQPGNLGAQKLLATYETLLPLQLEREREERLNRPKLIFDNMWRKYAGGDFFRAMEFRSAKPVKELEVAVLNALQAFPPYKNIRSPSVEGEIFAIEAVQEFSTVLNTSAGRRICIIVGGRITDDTTLIRCKVIEHKVEAVNKFSIGNLIKMPVAVTYDAIIPSQATDKQKSRLEEGVTNLTARIQPLL